MVLGMALDWKELSSSRGGDECAHRFCALERHYIGQWGEKGREQKLRMLSPGPSSQPLPKLFVCCLKAFPSQRHLHRDAHGYRINAAQQT